ncbi:Bulb-type lectin domain [Dillenia turbinata]|uniref:Receptor-like serine/threonine-protein kinase n=1 Tax=Dillenia turbinata TaxID=194707 RepID=A0AAN8V137_9MAGN
MAERITLKEMQGKSLIGWLNILGFLITLFVSSLKFLTGADNIVPGTFLSSNQTMVSAGGTFALGFFSPENSTKSYLGIWYNDIAQKTVIWVANRESPLAQNSSNTFLIGNDGNFLIWDNARKAIWSSNVSISNSTPKNTSGILMDTGNLVLKLGEEILWQSFDNPSDMFVPGMKISLNHRTHKEISLTSWLDEEDPQTGQFTFGIDPRGVLQALIWKSSYPYYRTDVWDGGPTDVALNSSGKYFAYITKGFNDDETYFILSISDNSIHLRYQLLSSGEMQLLEWRNTGWVVLAAVPEDECDYYARCGPYGSCIWSSSSLLCKCLMGFVPKNQQEWDTGNWTEGCAYQKEIKCNEDGFLRLGGMKLPDNSVWLGNLNSSACEVECLKNCSCSAYAYANMSVGNSTRCLHWYGELIDLVQNITSGQDIYVRLDSSELVRIRKSSSLKDKNKHQKAIVAAAVCMGLLFLGVAGYYLWRKRVEHQGQLKEDMPFRTFEADEVENNDSELFTFTTRSILAATNNFSEANKLGEGGFGPVYKGILPGNKEVAIKRLSKKSQQGLEEFMNELKLIAKLQHRNLVRLLGCCVQGEERMLIYEYMPNQSLDKFLFDPLKQANLSWHKRLQIIEDIAQGLLYLHKYSRLKVIHRDLKAGNVLLDGAMNPKISDFGMARIFGVNQTEAITNRVMGTYGYMSPEYAFHGQFSEKSDVFSFGVLLLEIVSGKRSTGFYQHEGPHTLLGLAWELWSNDRSAELIDPSIRQTCDPQEVVKCVHLGLLCVQESPLGRPTMSSVVLMLGKETTLLPSPREPAFSRIFKAYDSSSGVGSYSSNELTMSSISAR